jgi:sugar O-acyltransferase (sialic acid O-acetyltransferase NeuD family)
MQECECLVILGCGGHARSVADVALAAGYRRLIFIDDHARRGERLLGYPVERALPGTMPGAWRWIAAAGDNGLRQRQLAAAADNGWGTDALVTLIAPTATIGSGAGIGAGSFVGHHAHIGPLAQIGAGVIVNTGAVIEHDCVVGDHAHVSVHATVAGKSRIGARCFICAGATVIDDIRIGDDITLGAGALAIASLDIAGTYVGQPARRLPPG